MGFRFRKSINLGKGFKINLSKSGVGGSWGVKGLRFTRTANGKYRGTVSLPGTGLSYSKEFGGGKKDDKKKKEQAEEQVQEQDRPIGEEAAAETVQAEAPKKTEAAKKENSGVFLKVVLWILTVFFGVIAVTNMPGVVGYLSLVAAALLLPAEKWQAQISKVIPVWLKVVAVVGLAIAVLVLDPFAGIREMLPQPENTTQSGTQSGTQTDIQPGDHGQEKDYVLNTSSKKFHEPDCSNAKDMKESNKETFHGTREALIQKGYDPCGKCNP